MTSRKPLSTDELADMEASLVAIREQVVRHQISLSEHYPRTNEAYLLMAQLSDQIRDVRYEVEEERYRSISG
jgi:hypothetical protein